MKTAIVLAGLLSSAAFTANASTLLTNGDFEAGDVGFTSDLTSAAVNNGPAQYTVNTNPNDWFGLFADFGDHTTGTGNMMMVNGSTIGGDTVWSQTVNVTANTDYSFSGWIAAIYPGSSALSVVIGSSMLGSIIGPATPAMWENFDFTWNSGALTSVTISILQETTQFSGNDFALDDLSFAAKGVAPIPLPAGLPLLLAGLGGLALLRRRGA